MEEIKNIYQFKNNILLLILLLFTGVRVYIGNSFPYWYLLTNQLDDLLLINNAHLGQYFASWNIHTLSKTIGYSLFLKFVNVSGLSYGLILSIVWILAGILVVYAVYNSLTKNKFYLALIYLFIIFLPCGLDLFISGRIYRCNYSTIYHFIFIFFIYIYE